MSTSATVLILIAVTSPGAMLSGRPSSTSMTCAAAYNLVTQRGAVVIGTGGDTYDRAVAHQGFCERGEVTVPLYAPTLDKRTCFIGRTCIYDPGR